MQVKTADQMMSITFTTVTEYLYLLKGIAKIFNSLGANGMFYLAAAVSDFYLPAPEMVGQLYGRMGPRQQ